MEISLTLNVTVDEEHIKYFNSECGTSIRYWCHPVWDDDGKLIAVVEHGGYATEEPTRYEVPEDWVRKGLELLAQRRYPRLHELLRGDYDVESLDCLVQAGVLGEIRYS